MIDQTKLSLDENTQSGEPFKKKKPWQTPEFVILNDLKATEGKFPTHSESFTTKKTFNGPS